MAGEKVPSEHAWQADEAGTGEKEPAGHCAHAAASVVAPSAVPYLPATHVPRHSGKAHPLVKPYVPTLHGRQASGEEARGKGLKRPAGQGTMAGEVEPRRPLAGHCAMPGLGAPLLLAAGSSGGGHHELFTA